MGIAGSGVAKLRAWARALKGEILALWFAIRDPRTPWPARLLGALVIGYAISPIDLIPDFIPVIGHLDDLIILPVLIWLALRLIPRDVITECRKQGGENPGGPQPS